jgi:hypothetical protein
MVRVAPRYARVLRLGTPQRSFSHPNSVPSTKRYAKKLRQDILRGRPEKKSLGFRAVGQPSLVAGPVFKFDFRAKRCQPRRRPAKDSRASPLRFSRECPRLVGLRRIESYAQLRFQPPAHAMAIGVTTIMARLVKSRADAASLSYT